MNVQELFGVIDGYCRALYAHGEDHDAQGRELVLKGIAAKVGRMVGVPAPVMAGAFADCRTVGDFAKAIDGVRGDRRYASVQELAKSFGGVEWKSEVPVPTVNAATASEPYDVKRQGEGYDKADEARWFYDDIHRYCRRKYSGKEYKDEMSPEVRLKCIAYDANTKFAIGGSPDDVLKAIKGAKTPDAVLLLLNVVAGREVFKVEVPTEEKVGAYSAATTGIPPMGGNR